MFIKKLSNPVDHSNIFRNVVKDTCPKFDYDLWKSVALSGGKDIHYYEYDPGSGKYKEYGTETPVTFRQATDGQNGLFFFDSADGTKPRDDDGDGLYDNLAPDIQISGGGYESAGFIYLNAEVFRTTGSGSVTTQSTLIAPSEPYIDLNQNGFYDPDEYFIDLTYPALPTDPWVKNGMRREINGFTRQDPFTDAAPDGRWLWDINFTGVLYTNGKYEAQGNWTYFGSVITKQGMDAQGGAGTPDIYFDERVIRDKWPPSDLKLPRTHISVWETDM